MTQGTLWTTLGAAALLALAIDPASAQTRAQFTIKLNVGTPAGHPYNVGAEAFKRIVRRQRRRRRQSGLLGAARRRWKAAKSARHARSTILSTNNLAASCRRSTCFRALHLPLDLLFRRRAHSGVGQEMSGKISAPPAWRARLSDLRRAPPRCVAPGADGRRCAAKIRAPAGCSGDPAGARQSGAALPEVFNARNRA
jgi:hypothetical protein